MTIQRQNILDIIGAKSNRYHSCILTTFSFDFHFFEYKVMRHLRKCGISNVNVLVDGHYYSYLMNEASGEEMKHRTGYSLYPVFHSSVFHPKLWLLLGESEGLLIIGSGNLTHSGNGLNDEIWGAFHVSSNSSSNQKLFATAWQYLQSFCIHSHGLFKLKTTQWIRDNSKWLAELPQPLPFNWLPLKNNHLAALLYNTAESHIWDQLIGLIGQEPVTTIQVLSPYYDQRGQVLAKLHETFPDATIRVVLDEQGSIPHRFEPNESFEFYDWKGAGVARHTANRNYSRLHAKLIYFSTTSQLEYCLFGSANMTLKGMGATDSTNVNHEASLLIKVPRGGLGDLLGLTLTKNKSISSFTANTEQPIFEEVLRYNHLPIRLYAAEHFEDTLTIHSEGDTAEKYLLELSDSTNCRLGMLEGFHPKRNDTIKTGSFTGIHYVQIWSEDGQMPLSNKLICSHSFSILNTNPNTFTRELDQISHDLQESGDLSRVLDLLQSISHDRSEQRTYNHGTGTQVAKDRAHQSEPLLKLDEFKPVEFNSSSLHHLLLSQNIRILDLIQSLPSKPSDFYNSIQEDEQIGDVAQLVGESQSDITKIPVVKPIHLLRSEQRKLVTYFKRLQTEYVNRINLSDNQAITTDDLAKYLIALQLINRYGGRMEAVDDSTGSGTKFHYLPHWEDTIELTHVKGCCLQLIGNFLTLIKSGFAAPKSELEKRRQDHYVRDALIDSIVCILNTKWPKDDMRYLLLLLMNTMHNLGLKSTGELDSTYADTIKKVMERSEQLRFKCSDYEKNLSFLQNQVYSLYTKAVQNREQKIFETTTYRGNFIYTSRMGYCYVCRVEKKAEKSVLRLVKPGFPWDKKAGDFLYKDPIEVSSFVGFGL